MSHGLPTTASTGGSGAPTTADYLVKTADATLSAERVVTNTASITVDWATAGQAKFQREALTGDVTAAQNSNATTIANDAVTFAKMQNIATDSIVGRDTAGAGDPESITLGASLEFSGTGTIQRAALTGDVTASANSNSTAIASNAVTDAKLRDGGACSVIGRSANSSGDPADISAASNGTVLKRSANALSFAAVDLTADVAATILPVANGGTNGATATAGMNNLSPLTTRGDIMRRDATNTTRLAVGTANQILKSDGTDPSWADPYPTIILHNSTNSALAAGATFYGIEASSSTVARYIVPTGKTLYIVGVSANWDTGTGSGTWTIRLVGRKNGSTSTTLATATTTTASTTGTTTATGTIASPLATYVAGDALQVGWENDGTSPGAMGTNTKGIWMWGILA